MMWEYTLVLTIIGLVHGGYNNFPKSYDPKETAIKCVDTVCNISLVVEALESMTYYDYHDKFGNPSERKLKGYRAFYNKEKNDFDIYENFTKDNLQRPILTNGDFRPIFTINGQMPGPMIVADLGTMLKITVYNELKNNEGISIHWHGMTQKGTPEMDGVPYISQMPFLPNQYMTYEFKAEPAGTHWYHAHGGTQRTDGIFGALIVKDKLDPKVLNLDSDVIDMYENHTLLLMDWSTEPSHLIAQHLISAVMFWKDGKSYPGTGGPDNTAVGPFPFKSGLINDKGRYCESEIKCNLNAQMLNHFNVTPNNVYRFRLIGAQSAYAFKFSIEGHNLTVVATDGNQIQPIKNVQYVIVNSGERYDVLVDTHKDDVREYWILAETIERNPQNETFYNPLKLHKAEAILHYEGSTQLVQAQNESKTWNCSIGSCKVVNCPFQAKSSVAKSLNYDCHNVHDFESTNRTPDAIHNVDSTMFYNFDFNGDTTTNSSSVDGINFRFPPWSPHRDYDKFRQNEQDYICPERGCPFRLLDHEEICTCTHQIKLNKIGNNCSVQFVISNINTNQERLSRGASHPVHLHGHSFYVVKTGYPVYNETGTGIKENNKELVCRDWNENECKEFSTVKSSDHELWQEIGWADQLQKEIDTYNRNLSEKDTIIVPYGGYVIIRFIPDNPGWWFFHCHIEIHQMEGMAVVLTELSDEINYFQTKFSTANLHTSGSQRPYATLLGAKMILLLITLLSIE